VLLHSVQEAVDRPLMLSQRTNILALGDVHIFLSNLGQDEVILPMLDLALIFMIKVDLVITGFRTDSLYA
jgi:hypothetical protein